MEPADIVQDADFEAAARRGAQRLKQVPVAVAARYEQQAGRVVIELDCAASKSLSDHNMRRAWKRLPRRT